MWLSQKILRSWAKLICSGKKTTRTTSVCPVLPVKHIYQQNKPQRVTHSIFNGLSDHSCKKYVVVVTRLFKTFAYEHILSSNIEFIKIYQILLKPFGDVPPQNDHIYRRKAQCAAAVLERTELIFSAEPNSSWCW